MFFLFSVFCFLFGEFSYIELKKGYSQLGKQLMQLRSFVVDEVFMGYGQCKMQTFTGGNLGLNAD